MKPESFKVVGKNTANSKTRLALITLLARIFADEAFVNILSHTRLVLVGVKNKFHD